MMSEIDDIDRRLLAELQRDGTLSVDQLSERVSLSRNACWRRVRRLEEDGVITGRVALVDAEKLGLGASVRLDLAAVADFDSGELRRRALRRITKIDRRSRAVEFRRKEAVQLRLDHAPILIGGRRSRYCCTGIVAPIISMSLDGSDRRIEPFA